MTCSREEFLICLLARLVEGARSVAAGAGSPIPAAAALLAQQISGGRTTAMILGSSRHGPFNDGGPELFDRAGQGRIEAFIMGGGQIDGQANINLVGTGPYPRSHVRLPGSFGTPFLYCLIPRVILFREEHSRRVLVPKVDFISAPGTGAAELYRPGGPDRLVTGRAVLRFDNARRGFCLESMHPGESLATLREHTGFAFETPREVAATSAPDATALALLRGPVGAQLAEIYPAFTEVRLRPA